MSFQKRQVFHNYTNNFREILRTLRKLLILPFGSNNPLNLLDIFYWLKSNQFVGGALLSGLHRVL